MTTENAHCMSCRASWNRDMLETCGLSKKFVRETFKKRREDVLFERERSLMPATQPLVERAMKIRRLETKIVDIQTKMSQGLRTFHDILATPLDDFQMECSTEAGLERIERAYNVYEINMILNNTKLKYEYQINFLNNVAVDTKREARKFIRACPQNNCAGFLSTAWKCGVCENWACSECHEPKSEGHVCKPECIETAKMLQKDTKACPKCAAMIFKIDGCDQMFCTQCTTAFSWRTGNIETGRIHNPHYYEYNRNQGRVQREIGDIPCGGMPSHISMQRKCDIFGIQSRYFLELIRWHAHIAGVVQYDYRIQFADNQDLRIKFMMNDITVDQFKFKIQAREKNNEKRTAIMNVLNTYQVVTAEIMQRVYAASEASEIECISKEFNEIREYTNDLMSKISKRYQCVTPRISETLHLVRIRDK